MKRFDDESSHLIRPYFKISVPEFGTTKTEHKIVEFLGRSLIMATTTQFIVSHLPV
jgi:hypothetical protein